MNHQYHPKGGYVDRTKGLHAAQTIVQHKRDPRVSLLAVKPLVVWGGTRGIPKTVLVEKWCFRRCEDLLGVCGHFSATVKLPIPGVGRDLRMLGLYPQVETVSPSPFRWPLPSWKKQCRGNMAALAAVSHPPYQSL